jgi:hypothetical protein
MRSMNVAARLRSDTDDDPVAQDPRATRDRTTVAAALAHHRRGFPGDRRLVHRGDAFDHIAIRGDEVTGFADDRIAPTKIGGRDPFLATVLQSTTKGLRARPFQGVGLSLAASFRDRFGEIGEEDGEEQPERNLEPETERFRRGEELLECEQRTDQGHEHDRILELRPRIQLLERIQHGLTHDPAVEQGDSFVTHEGKTAKGKTRSMERTRSRSRPRDRPLEVASPRPRRDHPNPPRRNEPTRPPRPP